MAYTTESNIEILMGKSFTTETNPTSSGVAVLIGFADEKVDTDGFSGQGDAVKEQLSTYFTSHLISISKEINFKAADVSINTIRKESKYLDMYNDFAKSVRQFSPSRATFRVVND